MESLYFYCATAAGVIFLMQFVFGLLGMGHDADLHNGSADFPLHPADGLDADADLDHGLDHGGIEHVDHAGTWFVGVLSFRAIASAVLMFGLAGLSAERMYDPQTAFFIAAGCGIAVLFGVAYLLKTLYGFASDGTVRDLNTLGSSGRVYLTVPGKGQGRGKVTVSVQGRTMEYEARTKGETLPTGTPILVVDVPMPDVLEVVPVDETPSSQGIHHA